MKQPKELRIDARLKVLEDRLAILDMLNRYAWVHDRKDPTYVNEDSEGWLDAWMEFFTSDCVHQPRLVSGELGPLNEGRDALRELFPSRAANKDRRLHIYNSVIDELEGNTAKVRAYWIMIILYEGRPYIELTGRYTFELVKSEGRWRFRRYLPIHETPSYKDALRYAKAVNSED